MPDPAYPVGIFEVAGEGDSDPLLVAAIAVADLEGRLLVPIPQSASHRPTSRRTLPHRSVAKQRLHPLRSHLKTELTLTEILAAISCGLGSCHPNLHLTLRLQQRSLLWTSSLLRIHFSRCQSPRPCWTSLCSKRLLRQPLVELKLLQLVQWIRGLSISSRVFQLLLKLQPDLLLYVEL